MDKTPSPPPPPPPHVLIFPLPVQGPINCMLSLAELLCLAGGINVTFLNTLHNHRRLLRFSDASSSRSSRYPDSFRFEAFPDGLPEDHPRSGEHFVEVVKSVEAASEPLLRELLAEGRGRSPGREWTRVTCLVADRIFSFAAEVAEETGVPIMYFDTISPSGLWVYLCLPKLVQAHEIPFNRDDDLDLPVKSVSGMEHFLRRRDLPIFCRAGNLLSPILGLQLAVAEAGKIPRARGLILNTFEGLEESGTLPHLRGICPNLYAIGPLHSLLHSRLAAGNTEDAPTPLASSNSLWEEDGSCIGWLDQQPPRSVIYISIGSLAVMTSDQVTEIWHGLVNSGYRFLWVQRPGSVAGGDNGVNERPISAETTREKWRVVKWAPQEEVLSHAAVGAFLTHSGWNSTLESVVAGVPMICWPYFADQHVNSRHVSRVWGLGLDMKDTCDRATVEGLVRELMEVRRDQFFQSAQRTARLARESVAPGGSSFCNLDRLIADIRLMSPHASEL